MQLSSLLLLLLMRAVTSQTQTMAPRRYPSDNQVREINMNYLKQMMASVRKMTQLFITPAVQPIPKPQTTGRPPTQVPQLPFPKPQTMGRPQTQVPYMPFPIPHSVGRPQTHGSYMQFLPNWLSNFIVPSLQETVQPPNQGTAAPYLPYGPNSKPTNNGQNTQPQIVPIGLRPPGTGVNNPGTTFTPNFGQNMGSYFGHAMGANFRSNTGQNTRSNFGQNMRSNIGQTMRSNFGQNTRSNFGQNMRSNTGQNMRSNFGQNMKSNLGQNMRSNFGQNMRSNLGQNMRSNLGQNMRSNMGQRSGPYNYFNQNNRRKMSPPRRPRPQMPKYGTLQYWIMANRLLNRDFEMPEAP